jgi:phage tail sheath gpL-like
MSIPFANIPSNLRVPLFYAEVDNSQANSGQQTQRALIIGQITAQGSATAGVPVISQGASDAITQGGQGSMLALMTAAYIAADDFGEVWYLPLADASGAVAAAGSITVASAPTANGTLALYIAGQLVSVPVAVGDAVADVATAIVTAAAGIQSLPVSAMMSSALSGCSRPRRSA